MSTWIVISWVLVLLLTAINIVVFLQLKKASDQMLKMAFPGAKNMNEALASMQQMTQGLRARGGRAPFGAPGAGGKGSDAQLKAAMDMLQQMQKGKKR
ncbi:MAG TPA: hypothetical protein VJB59_11210 [Bdellovibrionota bacterium]|nr:hypothetical protein [Bdellovibrionota bacterium]